MKRTTKYVGLDVHEATTVVTVREVGGRVIARAILPAEAGAKAHDRSSGRQEHCARLTAGRLVVVR